MNALIAIKEKLVKHASVWECDHTGQTLKEAEDLIKRVVVEGEDIYVSFDTSFEGTLAIGVMCNDTLQKLIVPADGTPLRVSPLRSGMPENEISYHKEIMERI